MKLLALDSSGLTATAAVYADGVIKAASSVNNKKTHSQTLLPMIERVLYEAELTIHDMDAVAAGEGPGSFTGLRIGAATVKGLCLAANKPVVPVSSLAMIAYNLSFADRLICPIMDARRSQVYTALYRFEDDELVTEKKPSAMGITELLDSFKDGEEVIFAGDGVPVFKEVITDNMGAYAHFAPPHLVLQNASAAAVYAAHLYEKGMTLDAAGFAPVYLRLSQAERERLEREQKK